MAQNIEVEAPLTDPSITRSDVSDSLDQVDDVSDSSPISAGVGEAAVIVKADSVVIRIQGHDGEWSEQSETALLRGLERVDGVGSAEVVSGGHEPGQEGAQEAEESEADGEADESDGDDESVPVEEMSNVGTSRAQLLRSKGIETKADAEEAGVEGLAEAGISPGIAERILR